VSVNRGWKGVGHSAVQPPLTHSSANVSVVANGPRAGTTGVAFLMLVTGMGAAAATNAARKCRPVINPIGTFPQLLTNLEKARSCGALLPGEGGAEAEGAEAKGAGVEAEAEAVLPGTGAESPPAPPRSSGEGAYEAAGMGAEDKGRCT
jgi:hypothetical protein